MTGVARFGDQHIWRSPAVDAILYDNFFGQDSQSLDKAIEGPRNNNNRLILLPSHVYVKAPAYTNF